MAKKPNPFAGKESMKEERMEKGKKPNPFAKKGGKGKAMPFGKKGGKC